MASGMISEIGGSGDTLDRLHKMVEEEREKAAGPGAGGEGLDGHLADRLKEAEQNALAEQALADFAAREGIALEPLPARPSRPDDRRPRPRPWDRKRSRRRRHGRRACPGACRRTGDAARSRLGGAARRALREQRGQPVHPPRQRQRPAAPAGGPPPAAAAAEPAIRPRRRRPRPSASAASPTSSSAACCRASTSSSPTTSATACASRRAARSSPSGRLQGESGAAARAAAGARVARRASSATPPICARLGQQAQHVGCIIKAAHLVAPARRRARLRPQRAGPADARLGERRAAHAPLAGHVPRHREPQRPAPAARQPTRAPRRSRCRCRRRRSSRRRSSCSRRAAPPRSPSCAATCRHVAHELTGTTLAVGREPAQGQGAPARAAARRPTSSSSRSSRRERLAGLIEFIESNRTLDDFHGAGEAQDLAAPGHQALAAERRAGAADGLSALRPGRHRQDLPRRMPGRRSGRAGGEAQELPRQVGGQHRGEPGEDLPPAAGRSAAASSSSTRPTRPSASATPGTSDSGLSGRIYGMFAEQMSNPADRGRIVWILASSRPDLIEVDLKRPGPHRREDPDLPDHHAPRRASTLIRALCKRCGVELQESDFAALEAMIPKLLTPAAAESIAVKLYRAVQDRRTCPARRPERQLDAYRNPVPRETLDFQIALAVARGERPGAGARGVSRPARASQSLRATRTSLAARSALAAVAAKLRSRCNSRSRSTRPHLIQQPCPVSASYTARGTGSVPTDPQRRQLTVRRWALSPRAR